VSDTSITLFRGAAATSSTTLYTAPTNIAVAAAVAEILAAQQTPATTAEPTVEE
jgi:hypothetical protein